MDLRKKTVTGNDTTYLMRFMNSLPRISLTLFLERHFSVKANIHSTLREIPHLYGTQRFIIRMVTPRVGGGEFSTHGGNEKCMQKFGRSSSREEATRKDLSTDGHVVIKWIVEK